MEALIEVTSAPLATVTWVAGSAVAAVDVVAVFSGVPVVAVFAVVSVVAAVGVVSVVAVVAVDAVVAAHLIRV